MRVPLASVVLGAFCVIAFVLWISITETKYLSAIKLPSTLLGRRNNRRKENLRTGNTLSSLYGKVLIRVIY